MSSDHSGPDPVLQEAYELKVVPFRYLFSAHKHIRHNGGAHCSRELMPIALSEAHSLEFKFLLPGREG